MYRAFVLLVLCLLTCGSQLSADVLQVDFEGFFDSTPITTQYPGMVFSNTTALTAGVSLNDAEFPPHSGSNVALDDSGPITIDFLTPVISFSGFFTYVETLTLTAFDTGHNPVNLASSLFSQNSVSSGNTPNELISLNFAGGFSAITIAGDPAGGSFAVDDISVTTAPSGAQVPEPSFAAILGIATGVMFGARKLANRRSR